MNFEYKKKQKVVLISDFSEADNLFFLYIFSENIENYCIKDADVFPLITCCFFIAFLPFMYGSFLSALANIFSMECKGSVDDVKG